MTQLVLCTLDDKRYALPLPAVERVVRAVEITPLSERQGGILGVINVQGKIVPVVNVRRWLNLPEREMDLHSRMVIVREQARSLAIVVDSVSGIVTMAKESVILRDQIGADLASVLGVAKIDGEMIPVIDIARLFTSEVEPVLNDGSLGLPDSR